MFKKIIAMLSVITVLLSFSGCGCKHKWEDATCTSPKTCSLCGETEGEALEHSFNEATCTMPKVCSLCDETEGEALGHDYINGNCVRCGLKDPDYIDLNNLGFSNTYGMNEWLEITGYDFESNKVTVKAIYGFKFQIYYENYWQEGYILKKNVRGITSVISTSLENLRTTPCNVLSNDVIQYNGDTGWGPVTIIQRVVDSNNTKLVIKAKDETALNGSREEWFVPADLLDFSTVTEGEEENTYYISYKQ